MGRPRTPIGTFGEIHFETTPSGQVRARARYRDDDGQVRRVSAVGSTQKTAERNLKEQLGNRTSRTNYSDVTPDSWFKQLVALWLDDMDLTNKLAESTRALYERNMRQLVLPVFEHYALREITVGRVDRFLKALGRIEELQHRQAGKDGAEPRLRLGRPLRSRPGPSLRRPSC